MGGLTGPVRDVRGTKPDRVDVRRAPLPVGEGPQRAWPADSRWTLATRRAWEELWASPVILVAGDIDVPALIRLFTYYDVHERVTGQFLSEIETFGADALVSKNTQGGEAISVHLRSLEKLEAVIRPLEERFGITPLVRAKLGLSLGELQKQQAGANRPPRKKRQ